jgi:GH18 family chitinase
MNSLVRAYRVEYVLQAKQTVFDNDNNITVLLSWNQTQERKKERRRDNSTRIVSYYLRWNMYDDYSQSSLYYFLYIYKYRN